MILNSLDKPTLLCHSNDFFSDKDYFYFPFVIVLRIEAVIVIIDLRDDLCTRKKKTLSPKQTPDIQLVP